MKDRKLNFSTIKIVRIYWNHGKSLTKTRFKFEVKNSRNTHGERKILKIISHGWEFSKYSIADKKFSKYSRERLKILEILKGPNKKYSREFSGALSSTQTCENGYNFVNFFLEILKGTPRNTQGNSKKYSRGEENSQNNQSQMRILKILNRR